jgi:hypothetical protein
VDIHAPRKLLSRPVRRRDQRSGFFRPYRTGAMWTSENPQKAKFIC